MHDGLVCEEQSRAVAGSVGSTARLRVRVWYTMAMLSALKGFISFSTTVTRRVAR